MVFSAERLNLTFSTLASKLSILKGTATKECRRRHAWPCIRITIAASNGLPTHSLILTAADRRGTHPGQNPYRKPISIKRSSYIELQHLVRLTQGATSQLDPLSRQQLLDGGEMTVNSPLCSLKVMYGLLSTAEGCPTDLTTNAKMFLNSRSALSVPIHTTCATARRPSSIGMTNSSPGQKVGLSFMEASFQRRIA